MRLGDRVNFKTLFLRRDRLGTVCFVPRQTARERAGQKKPPQDWLLKLDDGTMTGWLYAPEDIQPPQRLLFVGRTEGEVEEISHADLERLEADEAKKNGASMAGQLIGCLILLGVLFGTAVVVQWLFF